jgi:predicted PurR-regulated permease PerM
MNNTTKWLVNTAALIVIALGIKQAAPFVTQVLMILFLAVIISPAYYMLRKLRFPPWLALTSMILAISLVCFCTAVILVPKAVGGIAGNVQHYNAQIARASAQAGDWLRENDIPDSFVKEIERAATAAITSYAKQITVLTANFFKSAMFVVIIVCFVLCEIPNLPKVRRLPWMTSDLWERLSSIALDVRNYMGIKTVVSALTGVLVYLGLLALGAPSPLLMGLLAFALNFVPYIGSIAAGALAVALVLAQPGENMVAPAVYVTLWYLAVNMALGNILEPKLMGRGFGVSPVLVLLSLIFWGWTLGPLGMFFAVPLTMAVRGAMVSLAKDEKTEKTEKTPPRTR